MMVLIFNFNNLSETVKFKEAKESLKTYLITQKHKAAYEQKTIEISKDSLDQFTNDLNILETSTRIVFFSDGSVQESFILVSSVNNDVTNRIVINVIGYISEEIPVIQSEENRLPIDYEENFQVD